MKNSSLTKKTIYMRSLFIVLLAMFLMSCNNSENSITGPDEKEQKGDVALTFSSKSQNKLLNDFAEPTNVRVLIRRFENGDLKFNALADVKVPTDTTVVISVPAYNDFQIDAFSYIDSTNNYILKVDQATGISVQANDITQVSLSLKPVSPSFSIPDSVEKGDNFNITANFDGFLNAPGYNSQYLSYLHTDSLYQDNFNNNNSDYFDGSSSGNLEWSAVSITEFGDRNGYFQVTSKVSAEEFYRDNERRFSFILNYPNPYITDSLKTYVKIPEGGIGIDISY